jgi:Tfp pilus assembly protein PilN
MDSGSSKRRKNAQMVKLVGLLQQQNSVIDQLVSDISILKKDIEDLKKDKKVKFNEEVDVIKEVQTDIVKANGWWWNGVLF